MFTVEQSKEEKKNCFQCFVFAHVSQSSNKAPLF